MQLSCYQSASASVYPTSGIACEHPPIPLNTHFNYPFDEDNNLFVVANLDVYCHYTLICATNLAQK